MATCYDDSLNRTGIFDSRYGPASNRGKWLTLCWVLVRSSLVQAIFRKSVAWPVGFGSVTWTGESDFMPGSQKTGTTECANGSWNSQRANSVSAGWFCGNAAWAKLRFGSDHRLALLSAHLIICHARQQTTPPVCLTAFAAATIAKRRHTMRTGYRGEDR